MSIRERVFCYEFPTFRLNCLDVFVLKHTRRRLEERDRRNYPPRLELVIPWWGFLTERKVQCALDPFMSIEYYIFDALLEDEEVTLEEYLTCELPSGAEIRIEWIDRLLSQ